METPGFIDSKFRLAILAAKRAKQLVSGAKKKIDLTAENPLTVALEEVYRGKISFQIFEEDEYDIMRDQPSSEEEDILEALEDVKLEEDDYEEVETIEEIDDDKDDDENEDDDDDKDDDNDDENEDDDDGKDDKDDEDDEDDEADDEDD